MLYRLTTKTMALALYIFCIILCFYGDGIDSRVAAEEIGDITFEETCDIGPDALTNMFGIPINRTCIDVPYNGDDDNDMITMERCYYTFVPESCATTDVTKLPLVMDVHGFSSCPLYSAGYTGWLEKAIEECFVVVWPTGTVGTIGTSSCFNLPGFLRGQLTTNNDNDDDDDDTHNNTDSDSDSDNNDVITTTITTPPCCCIDENADELSIPGEEPNDPLFLRMAIESVIDSFGNENGMATGVSIDTSRIYMAGHSNGCIASLTMAALHSDLVTAVCCHAGTLVTPYPTEYTPVPTFMVHGMKDSTIPFDGATILDFPPFGEIGFLSIPDVANYIANKNNCDADIIEMDVSNGTGVSYKRTNCTNNADVEIIALFEDGHFPYLTLGNGFDPAVQTTTIDTTSMAWEFCSSYSKQQEQETQESESPITNDTVATGKNETEKENEKTQDPAIIVTSNTEIPSKAPRSRFNDVSWTLLAMVALSAIITINIAIT